jgi:hypothetical protein
MFGLQPPWFIDQTLTTTVFCPWAEHDVTVRFLTCAGRPTLLIGCSEPECSMACLVDPPGDVAASDRGARDPVPDPGDPE